MLKKQFIVRDVVLRAPAQLFKPHFIYIQNYCTKHDKFNGCCRN